MYFTKFLIAVVVALVTQVQLSLAGPATYVPLINSTPYDWKLNHSSSYQISWKPQALIKAGTSFTLYVEYHKHHGDNGDCQAEAVYELADAPTPQSFKLHAMQTNGKKVWVEFGGELATINRPKGSKIDLGFRENAAISFILGGSQTGSYIGTEPPKKWMQKMLPTIGDKTLREISLPASHNAGLSELTFAWTGIPHNTQSQAYHLFDQLQFGARLFDIRPVIYYNRFFTGHFSPLGSETYQVGATGRTMENIVKDLNNFCDASPGELIILDVTHDQNIDEYWRKFTEEDYQNLYRHLGQLKDIWTPPVDGSLDGEDFTTLPISTFIQPGSKCAIIVRVPDEAPAPAAKYHQLYPEAPRKRDLSSDSSNATSVGRPQDGTPILPSDYVDNSLDTSRAYGNYPADEWAEAVAAWHETQQAIHSVSPSNNTLGLSIKANIQVHPTDPCKDTDRCLLTEPDPRWARSFIPQRNFPITGSFTNTRSSDTMVKDQVAKLGGHGGAMHMAYMTLTQQWIDIVDPFKFFGAGSVIEMAEEAHKAILDQLWPRGVEQMNKAPNVVIIDAIIDDQITAWCIAANSRLGFKISPKKFRGVEFNA